MHGKALEGAFIMAVLVLAVLGLFVVNLLSGSVRIPIKDVVGILFFQMITVMLPGGISF